METVLRLIELIYDAVPDASRWPVFLEAFVHAAGGRRGTLVILDFQKISGASICWFGWSKESMRLYNERYAAEDPWRIKTCKMAEGEIGTSLDLCSQEEIQASRAFREFYGPHDCYYGLGGIILRSETGQSAVIAQRGAADGPFGEREKSILRPLMPHLRRAALLHGDSAAKRAQLATFTGHLDRYRHPFLLADGECGVLYANAAAREIAARRDGLALDGGHIAFISAKASAAFREFARDVAAGQQLALRRLDIDRPSPRSPYRLLLMSVPASGALPLGVAQPAVAVVIIDSESGPGPDPEILRELFSLTPTEAKIAEKLVLGRSAEEIASETGNSLETVRTHIRHILSKTGTGRQGELISLILRPAPFRRL